MSENVENRDDELNPEEEQVTSPENCEEVEGFEAEEASLCDECEEESDTESDQIDEDENVDGDESDEDSEPDTEDTCEATLADDSDEDSSEDTDDEIEEETEDFESDSDSDEDAESEDEESEDTEDSEVDADSGDENGDDSDESAEESEDLEENKENPENSAVASWAESAGAEAAEDGGDSADGENAEDADSVADADESEEDDDDSEGEGEEGDPDAVEFPLESVVESLLICAPEPRTGKYLARAVGRRTKVKQVLEAVDNLNSLYRESGRSFEIVRIGDKFQIMSLPEYATFISGVVEKAPSVKKLSPTQLDTLAIVAYKQPVMRVDIETIRGVGCGQVLRSLIELGLVKVAGRNMEVVGQPMLYGTTERFLEVFGVSSVEELPNMADLRG